MRAATSVIDRQCCKTPKTPWGSMPALGTFETSARIRLPVWTNGAITASVIAGAEPAHDLRLAARRRADVLIHRLIRDHLRRFHDARLSADGTATEIGPDRFSGQPHAIFHPSLGRKVLILATAQGMSSARSNATTRVHYTTRRRGRIAA
jgi:hypothetical protein